MLKTITIGTSELSVDAEATQNDRTKYNKPCECPDCRNFCKAVEQLPALTAFLASAGVDPEHCEGCISFDGMDENSLLYEVWYAVYGSMVLAQEEELDGVRISFQFSEDGTINTDKTGEYFWIILNAELPWVLGEDRSRAGHDYDRKNPGLSGKAGKPCFLLKIRSLFKKGRE